MSTPLNFFIQWKNKSSWMVDIKQRPHVFTSSTALLFRVRNITVPLGTRCSFCCVFHRVCVWFQRCLVYPHKSAGCNKMKPYLGEGNKITLSFSGCQTAARHFLGQTRTPPAGSVLRVMLCSAGTRSSWPTKPCCGLSHTPGAAGAALLRSWHRGLPLNPPQKDDLQNAAPARSCITPSSLSKGGHTQQGMGRTHLFSGYLLRPATGYHITQHPGSVPAPHSVGVRA